MIVYLYKTAKREYVAIPYLPTIQSKQHVKRFVGPLSTTFSGYNDYKTAGERDSATIHARYLG